MTGVLQGHEVRVVVAGRYDGPAGLDATGKRLAIMAKTQTLLGTFRAQLYDSDRDLVGRPVQLIIRPNRAFDPQTHPFVVADVKELTDADR